MLKKRHTLELIVSFLLITAKAFSYDFLADGIFYNIEGDNVTVTHGNSKYEGEIIIPEKVTYNGKSYNVTSIGLRAFNWCSGLTSITIPSSVTNIGNEAFYYCRGLTSITISNSVTSIGDEAFYACSDLISITIPSSVTSIGYWAFYGCNGLTSIIVESGNNKYDSRNSCNAIIETATNTLIVGCRDTKIPSSVTSIGNYAFSYCHSLTSITIPNSVKSIGNGAFLKCMGLTFITIPNSVRRIDNNAFDGCSSLNTITIPNSVWRIGKAAFSDCNGLTSIISEIVRPFEIFRNVFSDFSKPTLIVPDGTKSVYQSTEGWNMFANIIEASRGNTSITTNKRTVHVATAGTLPNLISESEKYTIDELTLTGELNGTDLRLLRDMAGNNYLGQNTQGIMTSLDLSDAKIVVGGEKYLDTKKIDDIVEVISPYGGFYYEIAQAKEIPDYVFFGCCLKEMHIPSSVRRIGNSAFSCSGLTSISIPNSVMSIDNSAFERCIDLTSISIPNSVTNIGGYAFSECCGLTSIKVESGNTIYDSRNNCNAIIRKSNNELIVGCMNTTIPNSVTSIGYSAFRSCRRLTSISIPNSVTSIGNYSFYNCSGLTSISIPNSVTSIGYEAFSYCSGLKDIISEIKTPFEINENVFSVYSTATLTVPSGTKSAYQSTAGWNKFTNIVEKEPDNIIQGDANGDKEVNVADIVEVVNYINNNASKIFIISNADLNCDGEVNVTDIVWMVNIIMSVQTSSARTMSNRAGSITDGDCLTIDDVNINAGETKQVSISLNNPDKKYTAFQFDLTLPEGITIAKNSNGKLMASLDAERKDDHTLNVSELGNNTYRLLAFSMNNAELCGTNGALANITLQADANMDSGTNAAALKSQVFTATDGTQYKWGDLPFSIQVNGSENTGIDEISLNGQKGGMIKVYTLTGLLLFSIPQSEFSEKWQALPSGVYIVNGQKMIKTNDAFK